MVGRRGGAVAGFARRCVLGGLTAMVCFATAGAQAEDSSNGTEASLASVPFVVYGQDDREDWYDVEEAAYLAAARATCLVVFPAELSAAAEGGWLIATEPFTSTTTGAALCETERFRGQPTCGYCTAFLVAPDVVVTAGHCVEPVGRADAMKFVFGFAITEAGGSAPTAFPAEAVYFGAELLGGRPDTPGEDFAVIRLDRPVDLPGVKPLPFRQAGGVDTGTRLGLIGHPMGLPSKVAFGPTTAVRSTLSGTRFLANLDAYSGNSGSPVLAAETLVVEGILVDGDTDFVNVGGCWRTKVNSDFSGPGEQVVRSTVFARFVPLEASGWMLR